MRSRGGRHGGVRAPLPLLLTFLLLDLPGLTRAEATTTRRFKLQHSFGIGEEFADRGGVVINVDANTGLLSAAPSPPPGSEGTAVVLSGVAVEKLEAAAKAGNLYRVRAVPEEGSSPPIMTAVRLCDLVRANFRENVTLTVNAEGHLIGLEYTPRMSRLSPKTCAAIKLPETVQYSSAVDVAVDKLGQSIPLVAPGSLPPGIRVRLDESEAPPPPPKSFLQKYWIVIVLALLLFNTGGALEEEPPRGAGGAQQAAGGGGGGGGQARAGGGGAQGAGAAARRPAAQRRPG